MRFSSISKSALIISLLALTSCMKERVIEKTVAQDKITEKHTDELIAHSDISDALILQKESLGKAFLLSPTVFTTGKTPVPNFRKPMIVGFEKSGSRLAMYNYTDEQLYDSVPAQKLIQTFSIVKEDKKSITIDFKSGFKSSNLLESLAIVTQEALNQMNASANTSDESSLEVKDSFVKNVSYQGDSIVIKQMIRSVERAIVSKSAGGMSIPGLPSPSTYEMKTTEQTNDYSFELKPYEVSETFKAKSHDKDQRVGYFINFKHEKQQDEITPQIARWDISESKKPIEIRFSGETPKEFEKVLMEGIEYWNKAFGRKAFVKGSNFAKDEFQRDRTIHVYWVPWDSAGFAMAGIQADPLTGELLKGSVFMTSSWVKVTEKTIENTVAKSSTDFDLLRKSNCFLEQASLKTDELHNHKDSHIVQKSVEDTIRVVFTHELGHAIGLRHNFSGTFNNQFTDDEVMAAEKSYLNGTNKPVAVSTTVMDYLTSIQTAINGEYIKNNVLPYDQDAVNWGYFDKEMKLSKYNYCSDEHVGIARENAREIYGCAPFDRYKNVFRGYIKNIVYSESNRIATLIYGLQAEKAKGKSFYSNDFSFESFLSTLGFGFSYMDNTFSNLMFAEAPSSKFLSVKSVVDSTLSQLTYKTTIFDSAINDVVKKDLEEVGGYAGIVKALFDLQIKENGKLYQNQVQRFFEAENVNNLKSFLTDDEIKQLHEKLSSLAKGADEGFIIKVISNFAGQRSYLGSTQALSVNFPKGDLTSILPYYTQIYEKAIMQGKKAVTINGQEIQVPFVTQYSSDEISKVKSIFKIETGNAETEKLLKTEKDRLMAMSITKVVEVLKRAKKLVDIHKDSASIEADLKDVDWSKIQGITPYDLSKELEEYKAWELIKPKEKVVFN